MASYLDHKLQRILEEVFCRDRPITGSTTREQFAPGFKQIVSFGKLLLLRPSEEELQRYLVRHPHFIVGSFGGAQDVAFLVKPQIGAKYRADFAMLHVGQGGSRVELIEIERSVSSLFTKKGLPSKALRTALGQTQDWEEWIHRNERTFVDDLLVSVRTLPVYPMRARNGSFALRPWSELEEAWRVYGGLDHPRISFGVVIGRWSQLPDPHRQRLTFTNSRNDTRIILTYEQIARNAYMRPFDVV
jgi:hypothetical protein